MRSYVALSYIFTLTALGLFLWALRCWLTNLRQGIVEYPQTQQEGLNGPSQVSSPLNWPMTVSLHGQATLCDDGLVLSINPKGAYIISSAQFCVGQQIALSIDVPGHGEVRGHARVLWARSDGNLQTAAQLLFEELTPVTLSELFHFAGEKSLLVTGEQRYQPRA